MNPTRNQLCQPHSISRGEFAEVHLIVGTFKQFSKLTNEGLGELDKSGIAELTFKGRHLHK